MFGRIDHLLLEPLVAGERGVLTAAHPGHLFSHVLLESLDGHNQRRNHVHCWLVAIADNVVLHVMEQFRSRRGKRYAQHQHVRTADLLDQLRNFGVFAAVVALLAYQKQNSAILLRLGLKQIDGGAYGIQNRSATIARLEVVERVVDGCAGMSVIANEMGSGVESHQGRLTARVAEKQVEERTELG